MQRRPTQALDAFKELTSQTPRVGVRRRVVTLANDDGKIPAVQPQKLHQ